MQIVRVEECQLLQSLQVLDGQPAVVQSDELLSPQFLQGSIDVHGRQSQSFGQFDLSQRQRAGQALVEADGAETIQQLTKKMRRALERVSLPHIDAPLARH